MTIEVSDKQFAALVRGGSAVVGPSKRIVSLDDGPFVVSHYGPGPHPGTGTSQDVHGEGGGARGNYSDKTTALQKKYYRAAEAGSGDYLPYEFLRSSHDIFKHIPGTARWDRLRAVLDSIDKVHGINNWMALPLKETRAGGKGGSYHISDKMPQYFMIKFYDEYGESTEMSTVHEIGHYIDHWLLGEQEPYAPAWMSEVVGAQYGPDHQPAIGFTNRQDMVERIQKYPIQIGQSDFDVPDGELVSAGISVWDAITDSQSYRELKEYNPGIKKVTGAELPDDYFLGDRPGTPTRGNEDLTVSYQVPFAIQRNMLRPRENFARAYSQYIALRSENETMIRQVDEAIRFTNEGGGIPTNWEWDDFEPIAASFDRLFEKKGWLNPELAN